MVFKLSQNQRQQSTQEQEIVQTRRRFLKLGMATATTFAIPNALASINKQPERKLSLLNLHTGESINATYWAEGHYQTSELRAINRILRDHRTGEVVNIDQNLVDLLNILHHEMNGRQPFHVISGYRSPHTNAKLRSKSNGVAKKSLHMQGKAIDIRLPGRQLSQLHTAALNLKSGGVGYYPKSDFIHVDTGNVRNWR
jgi:uncharacterized protein YcbK (DUF882 family)